MISLGKFFARVLDVLAYGKGVAVRRVAQAAARGSLSRHDISPGLDRWVIDEVDTSRQ